MALGEVGHAHAVGLGDDVGHGLLPEVVVNLGRHHHLEVNGLSIAAECRDVLGGGGASQGQGDVRLLVVVCHHLALCADAQ